MCNCGRGAKSTRRATAPTYNRGVSSRRRGGTPLVPFPEFETPPSQEQADNPPVVNAPAPSHPDNQDDETLNKQV